MSRILCCMTRRSMAGIGLSGRTSRCGSCWKSDAPPDRGSGKGFLSGCPSRSDERKDGKPTGVCLLQGSGDCRHVQIHITRRAGSGGIQTIVDLLSLCPGAQPQRLVTPTGFCQGVTCRQALAVLSSIFLIINVVGIQKSYSMLHVGQSPNLF